MTNIISVLFLNVLNMSIAASVVILFVLLARFFIRKLPKIFSYLLWSVVIFRLLCPFSFTAPFSLLHFTNPQSVENGRIVYISEEMMHGEVPEQDAPMSGSQDNAQRMYGDKRENGRQAKTAVLAAAAVHGIPMPQSVGMILV